MINALKLGVSGGIVWGSCIALCTILAIFTGYSAEFLHLMTTVYPGYSISWVGVIIGLGYGFFDAFIGLYILAWLYNKLPL